MQAQPLSAQLSQLFKEPSKLKYRFLVFMRFLIAIVGGYYFTAITTALLSLVLPLAKQDAVLLCVSVSILIYSIVFILAFTVRSLKTVWISILLAIVTQLLLLAMLKDWV